MKRGKLLKILRRNGCIFIKHGSKHDKYMQPKTGKIDFIPRHTDVDEELAKNIIRNLF